MGGLIWYNQSGVAKKEHAIEPEVLTPDARLAGLLADRYDSVAAHPWRRHVVHSDAYAKLEEKICSGAMQKTCERARQTPAP